MTAILPRLKQIRNGPEWIGHALAAAGCLAALGAAWIAGDRFPAAWIAFMALSYAVGMRLPLVEAWQSLRARRVDIDFLMLLVAVGAWILGHPGEGAFLLVLFDASRAMESFANQRTRSAIEALVREMPPTARRLDKGREEEIRLEDIRPGDRLLVRPGEHFPVDCRIADGTTEADVSALTGEHDPVALKAEDEAPSGALNLSAAVEVIALRPAGESAYQKIIRLVEDAPLRRSPAQELSERVGRIYTAAILGASAAGFLVWRFGFGMTWNDAAYRAIVLLVAGSPCALVLSIPSAVLAAIAAGARQGILFHGGRGLLAVADVRTVAFDKTGTLTTGEMSIGSATGPGADRPDEIALAAELARSSTHPVSRAVAAWAGERNSPDQLDDIREVPGEGVVASRNGVEVRLGRGNGGDAKTARAVLSIAGESRIRFDLGETIRPEASRVTCDLVHRGLRVAMLSGDGQAAAEAMAREAGVEEARGDLRPEDKMAALREMSRETPVMMVGDGVNDAPALAEAHCGVAMGVRGSAAAIASADIVLANDRLDSLPAAIDLGRRARRLIRQNIALSIGAAAILVAIALTGALPLVLGVLGHEGGTVLVALNSLRLLPPEKRSGACARCSEAGTCRRLTAARKNAEVTEAATG